jgi:hypothetical protein
MVPQVPRTANRSRPGVAPPPAWRYRVPEAGNGWIIRPNIEPHGGGREGGVDCDKNLRRQREGGGRGGREGGKVAGRKSDMHLIGCDDASMR